METKNWEKDNNCYFQHGRRYTTYGGHIAQIVWVKSYRYKSETHGNIVGETRIWAVHNVGIPEKETVIEHYYDGKINTNDETAKLFGDNHPYNLKREEVLP